MAAQIKSMTSGNPVKLIVSFALPLMLGNIFQQLYSVVDSMVVGKVLGVTALAALGSCAWPSWLIVGMAQGLTQGFSIPMSQAFGARNHARLKKVIGNAVVLSVICAAILLILGEAITFPLLRLLGTPENIISLAALYLRVVMAGIPIVTAFNLFAAILRALGDGKTPLWAMAIASVINIILDILFVMYLGWGIIGAAVATIIAQFFSCVYCLWVMKDISFVQSEQIRCTFFDILREKENLHPDGKLSRMMLILSAPMVFQNFLICGGGMVVQSVVNEFSVVFIAGFTAGSKLHGVLEIATSSYGYAMTTYVGQNLGAGKMDRIHSGVRSALLVAILTSIIIAAVMLLSGRLILSGFVSGTADEVQQTIDIGYRYLTIMCVCLPVLYLLYIIRSSLQGMGNTLHPMISAFVEMIMRTSSAVLLTKIIGQDGVFIAEVAAWFGADVVLLTSYFFTVGKIEREGFTER